MQDINKIQLVSSELAGIWNTYLNDRMSMCVLTHFLNNVEDVDARPLVEHALKTSSDHIPILTNFFNQAGLPIPVAFSEKDDINPNAPRLFDDGFYLIYLSFMARVGMERYSQILAHIARTDLREFFSRSLIESIDLYNRLADVRLAKGLFIRSPQVQVTKTVQFIEEKSFMTEWFGEKRGMLAREITHIFASMLANLVGRSLTTGFGQVSKTKDAADYLFRGKDLAQKRIQLFSTILTKENIPIPSTSDTYVTDSTTAPFSEKLMIYHVILLSSISISDAGTAMSDILRPDLQATYARLEAETMKYASDGASIMIKNKWLEQPPQAINHENLVEV